MPLLQTVNNKNKFKYCPLVEVKSKKNLLSFEFVFLMV